jgi:predicted nucleotidyltransferase
VLLAGERWAWLNVGVRNDVAMELRPELTIDDEALDAFCRRHHVRRLAVFGSALRDDFDADSDIDVLVDFESGAVPGLLRLATMEAELGDLLGGREVELRTYEDLSPYFRDRVREQARRIYAA